MSAFDDPTGAFFGGLVLILGTIILVTLAWKGADIVKASMTARAEAAAEQEYRRLAQQAARSQERMADRLDRLEGIEARLGEIERVLREVDEPSLAGR